MKLKLKQLLLMGIILIVVVSIGSKFFGKNTFISPNKLKIADVRPFVENLPSAAFIAPPAPGTMEIVGIQQKDDVAVIYVRHHESVDRRIVTTPIEIVRLDSGRWYSSQISQFILE